MPPIKDQTGSTFNRGDFTATNAFFWSSLDLSPYAGTDLGSTPYYIEALDGVGKKATGYLGAVGTGETLGSELIDDPGFDIDGSWTKPSGWTISGSKANAVATATGSLFNSSINFVIWQLIKYVLTCDSYSSGLYIPLIDGETQGSYLSSSGVKTVYRTCLIAGYQGAGMYVGASLTATFTDISLKRVTDPPSTAVHIVSSLNGTTRNWADIESGFDPNNIASWGIYDSSALLSPSVSPSVSPSAELVTGGAFVIFRRRRRG